ncbi:hypothetical protein DFP78_106111 [Photobacterium lutimaris]|nr:hypothetical protein DFP78_106111 [Photobacterium lutimaris]
MGNTYKKATPPYLNDSNKGRENLILFTISRNYCLTNVCKSLLLNYV